MTEMADQRKPEKSLGKLRRLARFAFVLLVLSAVIFVIGQLVLSNSLATQGKLLAKLQRDVALLDEENLRLELEIAKAGSLTNIASQSVNFGFVKPEKIVFLKPAEVASEHETRP